jgi:hypothetical protein
MALKATPDTRPLLTLEFPPNKEVRRKVETTVAR